MAGATRASREGRIALAVSERLVLECYPDSVGVWTGGIGHTKFRGAPIPKRGMRLTLVEWLDVFERDLEYFERLIDRYVTVPLEQHERDAVLHWLFNTGAIATATLTKKLNAGDRTGAAAEFMKWTKQKELTSRRIKERDMFLNGDYGDIRFVPVQDRKGAKVRLVPADSFFTGAAKPTIRRDPKEVAQALLALGYDDVRTFQKARGLRVDGDLSVLTLDEIDEATNEAADPMTAATKLHVDEGIDQADRARIDAGEYAWAQERLRELGYYEVGIPNGVAGDRTAAALTRFQKENGLPATGRLDDATQTRLRDSYTQVARVSQDRARATKDDLKAVDPVVQGADLLGKLAKGAVAATGLGAVLEGTASLDDIRAGITGTKAIVDAVLGFGPWVIGGAVAVAGVIYAGRIVRRQVEAYRTGRLN